VIDLLTEYFPEIVDYEFTARMEDHLDNVARGELEWVPMVRDFYTPFAAKVTEGKEKIVKQVEVTDIACPLTGERGDMLVKRFGRNGWFLGCASYPDCKYTQPLPGEEPEALDMPGVGEVCPQCGEGHLAARRGRFGPFVACDRYPDCKYIKKDAAPASERFGPCPQCGLGTVTTKRSRRGRSFWGCDRYPECDYSTFTRPTADGTGGAAPAPSDGTPPTGRTTGPKRAGGRGRTRRGTATAAGGGA
jgi:DNA topoisomerase-1